MRRTRSTPPGAVTRALRAFLATEAAGGAALVLAAVVALGWANSPWDEAYEDLWHTPLDLSLGSFEVALDLRHWVNDGLMAIFFLVVGLEVKRELVEGELRDPRKATLPVFGALGGMAVPAALYLAVAGSGESARGWGIPMATDIAFALGVVTLLGPRVPPSLKLFLLTLAIVDDIGAIAVIALFYSEGLQPQWLAAAAGVVGVVVVLREAGVRYTPVFVCLGAALWLAMHEAGIHATLAGVAMGLLAPTKPALRREIVEARGEELADVSTPGAARSTVRIARLSVSEVEWLEHAIHPWTSFVIVPLFALANAGIGLGGDTLSDAAGSPVTLGVALGLLAGKPLGITAFSWLACRLRLAALPAGVTWRQVAGVATVAGIGFTVSLFITELAFAGDDLRAVAKVAILGSSVVAAGAGAAVLAGGGRR